MSRTLEETPIMSVITLRAEWLPQPLRREKHWKWQARIMDLYRRKRDENRYTWQFRENVEEMYELGFKPSKTFCDNVEKYARTHGMEVKHSIEHGETISLDPLEQLYFGTSTRT